MVIAHVPELTAAPQFFEQFVNAQFQYDPGSGAPTVNIPIQSSLLWGLGSPEKVKVDVPPRAMLDGLALTWKTGVGVTVGPITETTFEVPSFVSELAAKIRNS